MDRYLLRVNDLPVTSARVRDRGEDEEPDILVEDPEFGEFPLSRKCRLEYLDLGLSQRQKESDPFRGWKRVTYGELVGILRGLLG